MIFSRKQMPAILLPEQATPREWYAAEVLQTNLEKIFNTKVKLTTGETASNVILIGGPERNRCTANWITQAEFDKAVPGPEGMMLRSLNDSTILLAGSSQGATERERGTIYAVYEFLERYMGCCFGAYINPDVPGGAYIPQLESLELTGVDYVKARADSTYRTAIIQYADEQGNPSHKLNIPFLDWLVQNRYNRILTWTGIYDAYKEAGILPELEKRGFGLTVGHHAAPQMFLPPRGNRDFPEHYFETHPEYYKLREDGQREEPNGFYGQWIFCSRNQELIETISQNVITWIGRNPAVDIIAFWPQDGIFPQCVCEACKQYSKVENYTYFLNEVAKRVSAVYPYVKIDMLAYVDLWDCPEGLQLEPCLQVEEATWHASGLRKCGAADGSGIAGTFLETDLLKWHSLGAEVVYYDYYMGVYPARQRYIPIADEIQSLCIRARQQGIAGSGTQIECFNLWNHLFNFYVFARTAYDDSLSVKDHFQRFGRLFGEGAAYVLKVISKAEACLEGQVTIREAGQYVMANLDAEEVYCLYEQALAAAKSPDCRNNIRMMRMAFRYTDLETQESRNQPAIQPYLSLKPYEDTTGELYYMSTHFDSFQWNDPGYGITVPVDCRAKDFMADHWYHFEKTEEK